MTINSYTHTLTHTHIHTSLYILFQNRRIEKDLKQKINKSYRISHISYNPYITGRTISSYQTILLESNHVNIQTYSHTHTHHLSHTTPTHKQTQTHTHLLTHTVLK